MLNAGALADTMLPSDSSAHSCHAWYLAGAGRGAAEGRGCCKKRKSEVLFPPQSWLSYVSLLKQMGAIFFPLLNMFRLLLEYLALHVCLGSEFSTDFISVTISFGVREYIL